MYDAIYDVILVGAGPCGNMAALELSKLGLAAAVLDWRTDIGDKLCTGIIGRECAELLPPDPEHIHGEARSATIVSPFGRRYRIERSEPQAYIVNRAAYVNSVAESARKAGVEYILDARVTDIQITDREVKVTARAGDKLAEYASRIVILASGFGSPLMRIAGLKSNAGNEYIVGCQVQAAAPGLDETEVYLGNGTAQNSFAWLVPLSDSQALVGMAPRRGANGQMGNFITRLQSEGKIRETAGRPEFWGIPIRAISPSYADRTLAAGDAAGLVKPTTGGGIYYAFISGRIAAQAAHTAIIRGKYAANNLRGYEREWKAVFGKELRVGYYARMLFETLTDEQIESLLDEFLSDGTLLDYIGEDVAFDWHGRVIMKALRYTNIRRVITTLGPSAAPMAARLLRAAI